MEYAQNMYSQVFRLNPDRQLNAPVMRVALIFVAVSVVLIGYMMNWIMPGAVEPLTDRYIFAGICLLASVATFLPLFRKNFYSLLYIIFYIGTVESFFLLYLNDFHSHYLILGIIAFFIFSVGFKTLRQLQYFWSFTFALGIVTLFLVSIPIGDIIYSGTVLFFTGAMNYLIHHIRINKSQNLKFNNTLISTILNETVDAILIADEKGTLLDANSRAAEIFDTREVDSLHGCHIENLIKGNFSKKEKKDIQQSLNNGRIFRKELELVTRSGTVFWGDVAIVQVEVKKKKFSLIRITDITKLKNTSEQLRKAKDLAEAGARSKANFLATMSHEIRTPLNAVIGMSELLNKTDLDAEQQDFADTIRISGENLLALINDILDFSKIESGKLDLELLPVKLGNLIKNSLDVVKGKAVKNGLNLRFEMGSEVPPVLLTDGLRLRQVLLNLLSNAVKFTDEGQVKVTVEKASGADQWLFIVEDTGIGVPEAQQKKLFQSFTQVDSSTTRRFGGTGLGLAISAKLVDMLGGDIWLESEEGKGTRLYFTITAKPGELEAEETRTKEPVFIDRIYRQNMKGLKVLIAEDNLINQKVTLKMLSKLNVSADIANNGREVLEKLEENSYQIILMDIQMPEMDGLEASRQIKRIFKNSPKKPVVIAMTANALEGHRDECISAGMEDYIPKPVQISNLKTVLSNWATRINSVVEN